MSQTELVLEFDDTDALLGELRVLERGGTFVRGARGVEEGQSCSVVVKHPGTGETLRLAARVVWVEETGDAVGVGVALTVLGSALRAAIGVFVGSSAGDGASAVDPADDAMADDGTRAVTPKPRSPRAAIPAERLRHLSPAQQQHAAQTGDVTERTTLERLYGKNVWEALLRNPRITLPEVVRIARMHSLTQPLVELIATNTVWLASPQVRRALLANPRLNPDLAGRVLRIMPPFELKLVPQQTAYSPAVRDLARRMIAP